MPTLFNEDRLVALVPVLNEDMWVALVPTVLDEDTWVALVPTVSNEDTWVALVPRLLNEDRVTSVGVGRLGRLGLLGSERLRTLESERSDALSRVSEGGGTEAVSIAATEVALSVTAGSVTALKMLCVPLP